MIVTRPRARPHSRFGLLLAAWIALAGAGACSSHYEIARRPSAGHATAWFGPSTSAERKLLDRWSGVVGPPLVRTHSAGQRAANSIVLVSWNVAVGAGDVDALVSELRRAHPASELVLLLQETYREGPDVPAMMLSDAIVPRRLGGSRPRGFRDVESIAERSGLNVYYVPSMRNGTDMRPGEDRGNAILSTLPLEDLSALELPFERQRRVAVAATASGATPDGGTWRIRFVSAHLDNLAGPRRLWVAGSVFGRARQARALVDYVRGDDVAVVGGDFNTWLGFADLAFVETRRSFPDTNVTDRRPTFLNLLRLDHLFLRVPDAWSASSTRAAHPYGSDHWPLIATIRIG